MTINTTPIPKPAAPKPKAPVREVTPSELHNGYADPVMVGVNTSDKPKFMRRPHLTDRPFRSHEGLLAMQKQMEDSKPARQGQRRNNKEKK